MQPFSRAAATPRYCAAACIDRIKTAIKRLSQITA
jgi:hypothetical protein